MGPSLGSTLGNPADLPGITQAVSMNDDNKRDGRRKSSGRNCRRWKRAGPGMLATGRHTGLKLRPRSAVKIASEELLTCAIETGGWVLRPRRY